MANFEPKISYNVKVTKMELKLIYKKVWLQQHTDPALPKQFDYVECELPTTQETTIYEQILDEFEITDIIKAVNHIRGY